VFNGPIDLLLHLVSTHELDILEIPLAPLVDAFVSLVVATRGEIAMDQLSDFLLTASILLEIKSKRLLPGADDVEGDEELVGWEQRDLLLARLLELRAYSATADLFVGLLDQAALSIARSFGFDEGFEMKAPDLLELVTPEILLAAYEHATEERPEKGVDLFHVTIDSVTVAETVADLARTLPKSGAVSFRSLVQHLSERIEVIVHFLAVLELCKLGRLSIGQGATFGDLEIMWLGDTPDEGLIEAGMLEVDDYDG
jgi:segregation and condensation protein A